MKTIFTIIAFLTLTTTLFSLGAFNLFNGVNRSDLHWNEVNTPNVKIVYSDNLHQMALHSAAIADSTFTTLCKTFDIQPDRQVIIYISDQDAIPNGATLSYEYIFIWVDVNDYLTMFTGNHKWLRKVIAHEMVHWFVSYSMRDWLAAMLPVTMATFPGELHEGYAQFFSGEPWGFNRGDRNLRTFAFTDASMGASALWRGRYMYASGFSLVKYLAEFYPEENLTEVLKYRTKKANFFNFNEGFKKVYKKTFEEIHAEWVAYIRTYYYGDAYMQKVNSEDSLSKELSINAITPIKSAKITFTDVVFKGEHLLLNNAKLTPNQGYRSLIYGKFNPDSLAANALHLDNYEVIENAGNFIDCDVSPSGNYIVYTRYARHKHGRLAPTVYLYNRNTKRQIRVDEGSYPTVDNGGNVYFQRNNLEENNIKQYFVGDGPVPPASDLFLSLNPENQIGTLKLNPDASKLAATIFDQDNLFKIAILDTNTGDTTDYLQFNAMPQELLWVDNTNLAITLENTTNFKIEVVLYNTTTKEHTLYETPPYNIFPRLVGTPLAASASDSLSVISMNEINRTDNQLGRVNLFKKPDDNSSFLIPNSSFTNTPIPHSSFLIPNYYSRWINKEPTHKIPDTIEPFESLPTSSYNSFQNIKYRQGVALPYAGGAFGMGIFSEPLGKHLIAAAAYIPYDTQKSEPYIFLNYENNQLFPTINLFAVHTDWFAGIRDSTLIVNKLTEYELSASFPFTFYDRQFSYINYGLGLTYYDFALGNNKIDYSEMFDNKDLLTANFMATFLYSKPWRNSMVHPVRRLRLDLGYDISSEALGMSRDYEQFKASADVAYAPLLNYGSSEFLKTIALQNRTQYSTIGKDALKQHYPGLDDQENITLSGEPMFSRKYLRGFKETLIGHDLLSTQTDLRFKLLDDLNFHVNWGSNLFSTSYIGFSLWFDYTKLSRVHTFSNEIAETFIKYQEYKAMGYELQSQFNILVFPPMLFKYGAAFEPDGEMNQLNTYFMIEIPWNF